MILKRLEVGPFASNCYIVGAEVSGDGMIVDPGAEPESILKAVKDAKLDIKIIVMTHGHIDHISALGEVKKATNAQVVIHSSDAPMLGKGSMNRIFGFESPAVKPDKLLNGGETLAFGDMKFQVIHTPGHSQGCICLLGHGVLFSGDTLFNYGIGRYDLPGGDYNVLMNSLQKLMALPDDTVVYPGHGPETTIVRERESNPFLHG